MLGAENERETHLNRKNRDPLVLRVDHHDVRIPVV